MSPTVGKVLPQLALVQAELEQIKKNAGVEVDRGGSKTRSRYATMSAVHEACRPALSKHGFAVVQLGGRDDKGAERLYTILSYGGEWIGGSFPILAREGAQNFGGGLAFARRWGLSCAVGVFTSDDADEATGYKNAAADARKPSATRAPVGLAQMLEAIRAATDDPALLKATATARSAHPGGDGAQAVERTIADWFVTRYGGAEHLDDVIALRDLMNTIKPRGANVLDAMRAAGKRLEPK